MIPVSEIDLLCFASSLIIANPECSGYAFLGVMEMSKLGTQKYVLN